MTVYKREFKRKLGDVVIKIYNKDRGLTDDEIHYCKILESKGMAEFFGPVPGPRISTLAEHIDRGRLSAMSYYDLTGLGQELVKQHTQELLQAGRYLLPGEMPWYDQWPWKLVWPAVVSVITTLVVYAIKGLG